MNVLLLDKDEILVKALAICCDKMSVLYSEQAVILSNRTGGNTTGKTALHMKVRRVQGDRGVKVSYCPFCGDQVVINEYEKEE